MLFATDIVKTGKSGKLFFPPENDDYPLFGEKVYSPLSGLVVKIENEIKDNIPYSGGYPYNTGNTIVIRSGNLYMLLGHLQKESIKVRLGEHVTEGQFVAKSGNSGFSERPHIHIQLIESETENFWKGKGIEIRYDNKKLFKNRAIEIS
jgi:murein DD-endopeptidase MepM/ murein hydrolase activator NlpD